MTPAQADTMARQLAAALGPNSPSDDQLDVAEQWYDLAAPEQDQVIAAAARLRLNLTGRRT